MAVTRCALASPHPTPCPPPRSPRPCLRTLQTLHHQLHREPPPPPGLLLKHQALQRQHQQLLQQHQLAELAAEASALALPLSLLAEGRDPQPGPGRAAAGGLQALPPQLGGASGHGLHAGGQQGQRQAEQLAAQLTQVRGQLGVAQGREEGLQARLAAAARREQGLQLELTHHHKLQQQQSQQPAASSLPLAPVPRSPVRAAGDADEAGGARTSGPEPVDGLGAALRHRVAALQRVVQMQERELLRLGMGGRGQGGRHGWERGRGGRCRWRRGQRGGAGWVGGGGGGWGVQALSSREKGGLPHGIFYLDHTLGCCSRGPTARTGTGRPPPPLAILHQYRPSTLAPLLTPRSRALCHDPRASSSGRLRGRRRP